MTAMSTAPLLDRSHQFDDRLRGLGCVPLERVRRPSWFSRLLVPFGLLPGDPPSAIPDAIATLVRCLPTGGWSIPRDTAHALAAMFVEAAPLRVLELGSGVSTVLLAALCARSGRPARVISFEEKHQYAERTRRLLAAFKLDGHATVLVSPVARASLGAWTGFTYRPDEIALRRALGGGAVDFLFVDGPASWGRGRGDCRYGALELVRPWAAPRLVFAVDDAWRTGDLAILRRWQALPGVEVEGVIPVGRGLGAGTMRVEGLPLAG
jgi:hypothetical protein